MASRSPSSSSCMRSSSSRLVGAAGDHARRARAAPLVAAVEAAASRRARRRRARGQRRGVAWASLLALLLGTSRTMFAMAADGGRAAALGGRAPTSTPRSPWPRRPSASGGFVAAGVGPGAGASAARRSACCSTTRSRSRVRTLTLRPTRVARPDCTRLGLVGCLDLAFALPVGPCSPDSSSSCWQRSSGRSAGAAQCRPAAVVPDEPGTR